VVAADKADMIENNNFQIKKSYTSRKRQIQVTDEV
jgi:hypothetical protein